MKYSEYSSIGAPCERGASASSPNRLILSRTLIALALATAALSTSCRRAEPKCEQSPERALEELKSALEQNDLARLYDRLDRESKWSVMSIQRAQRQMCQLVEKSYPKDRRAQAMERCRAAVVAPDERQFFAAYARATGLLDGLLPPASIDGERREAEKVVFESAKQKLPFCKRDGRWCFCGIRTELDSLKTKAARDLLTITENAEAFQR